MSKIKVYLAGPMRGLPDWNFSAFEKAAKEWTDAGFHVFSPALIAQSMGYGLDHHAEPDKEEGKLRLQHVILSDIACIFASDAIALLSGWEKSRGVTVELALAQFLGLPSYCAETMERIYPPVMPWAAVVGSVPVSSPYAPPYHPVQSEADDWSDVWRRLPIAPSRGTDLCI